MKKKNLFVSALVATLLTQPISVFASAAMDGKTDASTTPAALNGAWEKWTQQWSKIENDWTYVSLSPGKDETEMNFAWYSHESQSKCENLINSSPSWLSKQ